MPSPDNPLSWQAISERWAAGECRCPYCYDDDETFHTACDCWYHDQACAIEGCRGK